MNNHLNDDNCVLEICGSYRRQTYCSGAIDVFVRYNITSNVSILLINAILNNTHLENKGSFIFVHCSLVPLPVNKLRCPLPDVADGIFRKCRKHHVNLAGMVSRRKRGEYCIPETLRLQDALRI